MDSESDLEAGTQRLMVLLPGGHVPCMQGLFFSKFVVECYTFANEAEPVPGHLLHEVTLRVLSKETGVRRTVSGC